VAKKKNDGPETWPEYREKARVVRAKQWDSEERLPCLVINDGLREKMISPPGGGSLVQINAHEAMLLQKGNPAVVAPLAWIVREENGMLSVMERDRFTEAYEPLNAVQASPDLEELAKIVDILRKLVPETVPENPIAAACQFLGTHAAILAQADPVVTLVESDGQGNPDVVQETEGS
jgi:hypothetical protein